MNFSDSQKLILKQAQEIQELRNDLLSFKPYFVWIVNLIHIEHHDRVKAFQWEQCQEPVCLSVRDTLGELEELNATQPTHIGITGDNPMDGANGSPSPSPAHSGDVPQMPQELVPRSEAQG